MPSCAAVDCRNKQFTGCGKTFHLFPFSRPDILKQWLENMKRELWTPSKRAVLCSDHFEKGCFDKTGCTTRIRTHAIPTLFSPSVNHRKKIRKRKLIDTKEDLKESPPKKQPRYKMQGKASYPQRASSQKYQLSKPTSTSSSRTSKASLRESSLDTNVRTGKNIHQRRTTRRTGGFRKNSRTEACIEDTKTKLTLALPLENEMEEPSEIVIKKEKEDTVDTNIASLNKLAGKDKVTHLPNDIIHFEFSTPRRHVILKLNSKTESSELKSNTLQDLLSSLRERNLLTSDAEEWLNVFGALPDGLKRKSKKTDFVKVSCAEYSVEVKKFATVLFLNSPETYDLICKLFMLPDKSVIKAQLQVEDYWPGFTKEALKILKNQVSMVPGNRICSVMFDSVRVKSQCDFVSSSGRWIGPVDFGGGLNLCDTDDIPLATEVLVFTAVGLGGNWKLPYGYFLNKGLSGDLLKNIVMEAILVLEEYGLSVRALVCNGFGSSIKMAKLFGCNIHTKRFNELVTFFPHPLHQQQKIHLVFGIRHTLQLLKNLLADKGSLRSSTYGKIEWKFLKQLIGDTENRKPETVELVHPSCSEFYHLQRIIRQCKSTFSFTLSNALDLASQLEIEEYIGSGTTSIFVADVQRAFNLLNSRNSISSEDKPPIRQITLQEQVESMTSVAERLISLELMPGKYIAEGGRWMSVVLFAFTLKSVSHLAAELVNEKALKYFNTYRVNLDHLDMVLSSLQRYGGWESMPSPAEFQNTYRSLFERSKENIFYSYDFDGEDFTVGQGEIYIYRDHFHSGTFGNMSHYSLDFPNLTDLRTDALNGGKCVVRLVAQRLSCLECMAIMVDDDPLTDLKTKKVNINIIRPSRFVLKILKISERELKVKLIESNVIEDENLVFQIYSEYLALCETIDLPKFAICHFMEDPYHIICLIKVIIRTYITLRLHKRKELRRHCRWLQYS